jgi:hypothetical protein
LIAMGKTWLYASFDCHRPKSGSTGSDLMLHGLVPK